MTRDELYTKAINLPLSSGVYIMKNSSGEVIYVGKSKKLRNRVSQYFALIPHTVKTEKMVNAVYDFDYILTDNETEALVLENIQIKKYLPKYNILLKDDKNYPYIKLSSGAFPKLSVTRKRTEDKGEYFGPYSNIGSASRLVDEISKIFSLPTCKKSFPAEIGKTRPCLNHHIGRCMGVCTGKIDSETYNKTVSDVRMFLKGHQEKVISSLTEQMEKASENLDYEKAASYRDTIKRIKALREHQKVQTDVGKNVDVVAFYDGDNGSAITLATVRDGCFADKITYRLGSERIIDSDTVISTLYDIYSQRTDIPQRILTNIETDGFTALEEKLGELAGKRVHIDCAKIGDNKKLCDMILSNAKEFVEQYNEKQQREGKTLILLAKKLCLEVVPERIESYDVSNWGNDFISTGMIVIENGSFAKHAYRSFNAKENTTQNDCACMAEAVKRRFQRALDGDESFLPMPDLILADGAKGQVDAISEVLRELSLDIPVFGMVKDRHHKTRTLTNGCDEISIANDGEIFGFIYRIQEEVHRFSLQRMDKRRRENIKHSSLEKFEGIGASRAKALMRQFGGFDELKTASIEQISATEGFSQKLAEKLYKQLHESEEVK